MGNTSGQNCRFHLRNLRNFNSSLSQKSCPRPLITVRSTISTNTFFTTDPPRSKADCSLRIAEYGEAINKVSEMDRNNRGAFVKARCAKCPFRLGYHWVDASMSWADSIYVPHSNGCDGVNIVNKPHTMTAAQAAPALYPLLKSDPKLAKKTAKAKLEEYMARPPSDYFVGSALETAREDMAGKKDDQAALIMSIKQALEADGHYLEVLEMSWEGQYNIILERRQTRAQKKGQSEWWCNVTIR